MAVGQHPDELDLAAVDDVDAVAGLALAEQHLALGERDARRSAGAAWVLSSMTRSASGTMRSSWVATTTMRPGCASSRQEPDDPVDLDVVEVRGRFVGQHQHRVVHERARDRDAFC